MDELSIESKDSFEVFLEENTAKQTKSEVNNVDLEFQKLDAMGREDHTIDPLSWWDNINLPILKELSHGLLSIATSQADVERIFSTMAFIMNPLRCGLTDDNLKNIIFCKINRHFCFE